MAELSVILAAFLPVSELVGAVPVGFAVGLPPPVIWLCVVLGNCAPIVVIRMSLRPMRRIGMAARVLRRIENGRVSAHLRRHGDWLVLAVTPLIGVWFMTIAACLIGMPCRRTTAATVASIAIYALLYTVAVAHGIRLFT